MSLLHRLWPRLVAVTAGETAAKTPRAATRCAEPAADGADEELPCRGCGWFDSSHELQTGLLVTEHDHDATVAATLPLATWLNLHLADWRNGAGAAAH